MAAIDVELENGTVPDIDKYVSDAGATGDVPSGGQQVVCKLLVSNATAGSVIGKAGQTIEQIQRSSGARVQLSRAGEFYPGTSERVLLLSGSLHAVLTAIFLMLEKLPKNTAPPTRGTRPSSEDQVKLAVSRKLCGAVIGQKGQTVRDFMTDSGATIRVQPLSELTPSDPERLITILGGRDQVLRAVALVLNTLSADDKYATYMELTLQLANTQGLVPASGAGSAKSAFAAVKTTLTMFLPDEDVGAILGKRGQTITQIQQSAKVGIKISDRTKMDPTTNEREVVVSGTFAAIHLATAMLAEKLSQNKLNAPSNRVADSSPDQDEEDTPVDY